MPRIPRICPAGYPVHVIQRGNNRQNCFVTDADRKAYAHWMSEAACKFDLKIHAWVFMTNHVHLLVTPSCIEGVSHFMQHIGRFYVRYFNHRYGRTGTLYEGRFKSNVIQSSEYFLACQRYIELNPVRAGMVKNPVDHSWSSFRTHAFGIKSEMWTPHPEYLSLGETTSLRQKVYRGLFAEELSAELVSRIRDAARTGLVLGTNKFRMQIEKKTSKQYLGSE